jgi:epoxyqueuosine reductase
MGGHCQGREPWCSMNRRRQAAGAGRTRRPEGTDSMLTVVDRHVIGRLLAAKDVDAWGVAANHPPLPHAPALPFAISLLMRLDPQVVAGLHNGPGESYLREYRRLNKALDRATSTLVEVIGAQHRQALAVPATQNGGGNAAVHFSHKAAATSAGLGWIGKTALFVSAGFGPAVRLATVFTDLELPTAQPVRQGRCGDCRACVDACPAGCGRDVQWRAGMARDELFDAAACRHHMTLLQPMDAQLCGICIAACPHATRA